MSISLRFCLGAATGLLSSFLAGASRAETAAAPAAMVDASQVRLLPGSPFYDRQELHRTGYVGQLDPDRLLFENRKLAGLPQLAGITAGYGGWDSGFIRGHMAGHYLSTASRMAVATGDDSFGKKALYLVAELAKCQQALNQDGYLAAHFNRPWLIDPLAANEDRLKALHANTHIAQLAGIARYTNVTGDNAVTRATENFWEMVVRHHSFAIGGNSYKEWFDGSDVEASPSIDGGKRLPSTTAESCNTQNMLKLTARLIERTPDRADYADYYERALYNHLLATIAPDTGAMTYFTPLRGDFRTYLNGTHCCVGSGIENTTRYNEGMPNDFADKDAHLKLPPSPVPAIVNASAKLDQHVVIARRSGQLWYVASMNGDAAVTLDVPLDFLGSKRRARSLRKFADGADPPAPETVVETTRDLGDTPTLTLRLSPSGGYAATLSLKP